MSRLQVGGLALVIKGRLSDINVGKMVELVGFVENYLGCLGDCWMVDCKDGLVMADGSIVYHVAMEHRRLIPLGDQQTQDELRKEEFENV